jgi:hypothetical protein
MTIIKAFIEVGLTFVVWWAFIHYAIKHATTPLTWNLYQLPQQPSIFNQINVGSTRRCHKAAFSR